MAVMPLENFTIMKLPTDEQLLEELEKGLNSHQIAAKFKRTQISIQTRITNMHVNAEMEQYRKNRPRTTQEKTEDEIRAERMFANPRVGDVVMQNGELVHRYTGEVVSL